MANFIIFDKCNACNYSETITPEVMVVVYHNSIKGPICGRNGPHGPFTCRVPNCDESRSKLIEDLKKMPELKEVKPMTFLEAYSGNLHTCRCTVFPVNMIHH